MRETLELTARERAQRDDAMAKTARILEHVLHERAPDPFFHEGYRAPWYDR